MFWKQLWEDPIGSVSGSADEALFPKRWLFCFVLFCFLKEKISPSGVGKEQHSPCEKPVRNYWQ